MLKRPDEKFVTERAYDNPKFVEDTVRDVAVALNKDKRVRAYVVEAENLRVHTQPFGLRAHRARKGRCLSLYEGLGVRRALRRRRDASFRALQPADHAAQEHLVEAQLALGGHLLEQR